MNKIFYHELISTRSTNFIQKVQFKKRIFAKTSIAYSLTTSTCILRLPGLGDDIWRASSVDLVQFQSLKKKEIEPIVLAYFIRKIMPLPHENNFGSLLKFAD